MVMSDIHRVLVSEGGGGESRAALSAVRGLRAAGYRPSVTVSGSVSFAGASRHCERRIRVPGAAQDAAGYAAAVRHEMSRRRYVTVFPASDAALLALGAPVNHLVDKVRCAALARNVGLDVPPTEVFASREAILSAGSMLPYPVVVKPAIKYFAARRVDGPDGLRALPAVNVELMVQPFLADRLRGMLGLVWEGRLIAAVHLRYERVWPFPCGTVAAAETVEPDIALEEKMEGMLAGYSGLVHADLAGSSLLDLNPRIHATLPVAIAAGVNLVGLYCDLLRGAAVVPARGRAGVFFRHVAGDVRSVVYQLWRHQMTLGHATKALRPRRGAIHSTWSVSDPVPMVAEYGLIMSRVMRRVGARVTGTGS